MFLLFLFQILDLSYNRIRDLDKSSFSQYYNLKYLYLFENMIQNIAEGTFEPLQNLEAIDLSVNALQTIPPELYTLPLLRNLHIQNNHLTYLVNELEHIEKPIAAPLEIINLSECKLNQVPNFGSLPQLFRFNLSGNALSNVKPTDFSPYCSLRELDLNNTQMSICTCTAVADHLGSRSVTVFRSQNCRLPEGDSSYCQNKNKTEELPVYGQCLQRRIETERKEKSSVTWLSISLSLVGFFIVFISFLYCLHKRNTREIKRQLKKQHSNFRRVSVQIIQPPPKTEKEWNEKEPKEKESKTKETLLDVDKS